MDDEDELSEDDHGYASSSSDEAAKGPFSKNAAIGFVKASLETRKDPDELASSSESEDNGGGAKGRTSRKQDSWQARSTAISKEYDENMAMDFEDDFRPSFGKRNPAESGAPLSTFMPSQYSTFSTGTADAEYRPSFAKASNPSVNDETPGPSFVKFQKSSSSSQKLEQPQSATEINASGAAVDEFGRDVRKAPETQATEVPSAKLAKDAANHQMKMMLRGKIGAVNASRQDPPPNFTEQMPPPPLQQRASASSLKVNPPAPLGTNRTGFSSMALKYLQKHNFEGRLGKHGQGIAAPIEVKARPGGAGLGSVEEASALPANRANTEHLERIRREAEQKEARERKLILEQTDLARVWRKQNASSEGEPLVEYGSTEIAKAIHDETIGERTVAGVNRALLVATEKGETVQRELSVQQALSQMKRKEREESADELRILTSKTSSLADIIGVLLAFREETSLQPAIAKEILMDLQTRIPHEFLEEYELNRLPSLILRTCVQRFWDTDQDRCLDTVEALEEVCSVRSGYFTSSNTGLLSALMKHVVPRLDRASNDWRINDRSQMPLHLLYLPWLPHLLPALDSVLVAPVKALEREFTKNWTDLTAAAEVSAAIQPWKDVCGGTEFVHELIARSFGSRLFDSKDVKLIRSWYTASLLSTEDFASCCEGALQQFLRDSEFTIALKHFKVKFAANLYSEMKALIPLETIKDSCCRGKLRHLFQYALELLRATMDGTPVDPGVASAIEPEPVSFSDSWYRNRINATKPVEVAADFTTSMSLQATVESVADGLGKDFYAHPSGRKVDGKKVFVLGSVYCYFDVGVIYASRTMKDWRPVSLDQLMEMDNHAR